MVTNSSPPPFLTTLISIILFSMLRHTSQRLQLISDVDMLLFLERGIRGGVSYCATRMAETNDADEPAKRVQMAYLDANNLVRHQQQQQ